MSLGLSEFAHSIEVASDDHIVFNSLFLKPVRVVGEGFDMQRLPDLAPDKASVLAEHHILVEPGTDDKVLGRLRALCRKPSINTCVLVLTEKCNLRCRYCFIEKNLSCRKEQRSMEPDMAKRALRYFARVNRGDSPSIVLYGGEPLVNRKVLGIVLEEIDAMVAEGALPRTRVSINTNGTLLDDDAARLLAEHGVTVSVSLDGGRRHNSDRVFKDGSESYDAVLEGIAACRRHGVKYGISVTATPRALGDYAEGIREIGSLKPSKVGINPLLAAGELPPGYGEAVCDMMFESKRILNSMGVDEDRLTDRLGYLESRCVKYHDCSAAKGEQIVIAPDGSVGICHEFLGSRDFFFGHVDSDEDIYSGDTLNYWVGRTPLNMEQCRRCPALAVCGGGCPANALQNTGDLYGLDLNCCGLSRRLIERYFSENRSTEVELRL